MADPDTFDVEQLNFFRTCCTTYQVIPDGLRKVFKKEWDARYQTSHGEWNDTAKNGGDFFSLIPPKEQKLKAKELSIIRNGNRGEWDCTCLFYAILYSNCIGKNGLHLKVKKAVDNLRQYRNKYAHYHQCKVTDADFQTSTQDVINAFDDLNLDTNVVKKLKTQTSFQTDELKKIQEQLDKEKRRNQEPQTFCDLPPKPSHEAIPRSSEVDSIIKEMKCLQSLHPNEVTYVYLSGNPGSGKSETARQIGERFFDETASVAMPTFVATLNASSVDTLLRSYINFSRLLRIEEDYIQSIACSKALSQDDKIWNLIGLVNPKLALFSSWLLIVDNVVDLKKSSMFFPTLRQKVTGKGQVLVTTQESQSISPASPKIYHKSLSEGMKPDDAVHALCTISQHYQDRDVVIEIAKALDFQPLALACTAVYMNLVNQHRSTFTWSKCLTKIQEGKREQTEKPYINTTGQVYPQSMTTAVKIALSKVIQADKIMVLAFEYLSVLAQDPIPIKYLVQYVQLFMPDEGEELIEAHIARSSLVLIADDSLDIHVHQIVHSILQESIRPTVQGDFLKLTKVISTFSHLNTSDDEAADYNFVKTARYLAPHFKVLVEIVQSNFHFFQTSNALNKYDRIAVAKCLWRSIGEAFLLNGEFRSSRTCFEMSLALYNNDNACEAADILMVRNKLGETHYDFGEFSEAKVSFEEALTRLQYSPDDNNEQECSYYLRTITNLAMTTSRLEEFNEAEKYVRNSISLLENCRSSPFLGKILNNLAMAFNNLNKHAEAKTFMQQALAVDQERFGKDHPTLAIHLSGLGLVLQDLGQYEEARKCMERALAIDERIYDGNHPTLAIHLNNLGSVLQDLGQCREAKKCIERAVAIDERIYDDSHPTLAIHLNGLGLVLQDLGQCEEGRKCMERALAINERIYDGNHPTLARNLNNLGLVLRNLRRYEEAKICFERSLTCYW